MKELYEKDLNEPDYYDGVVSHPEPDALECEIKRALRKLVNEMKFQQNYSNPYRMMPSRFCIHYVSKSRRPSSDHWTGKGQFSSQSPRRVVSKNVLNHGTIAVISYTSKVMLKILNDRLQHYANQELADVQAGFKSRRGTRDQIANFHWITEKARKFQKNIYLCFIDYAKAFDCVDPDKFLKALRQMGMPDHLTCLLRNLYAGQEATE